MPDIALFEPDIPVNTGTILRLAACMGTTVHLIEPAGFPLSDHSLKRAGMDYLERAALRRHLNWVSFDEWRRGERRRLVLLSTSASLPYSEFAFGSDDILLFGRESAGVPEPVHDAADARLLIPMAQGLRSLNVAVSAAMVLGEALRQTASFPNQSAT
ncbi:tRNA (cytidine(34)-2'-O)-methyltransferase [Stappia sp. F7233]|uniref:tRNA (cytidine(34)-2'-O)-methyltransferase n=1 Tax=Stappia albiluteola TaxID=2758565 RepID=A0A839A9W1_9HYPH|nr:tRNA (cytidine(34)-2'-O)-methyltransferase [Stappia albiluteola]MBA5775732.1 tRNA (cytidine(34)-2'-O)-methyltransferase [Stappia albiluteola]